MKQFSMIIYGIVGLIMYYIISSMIDIWIVSVLLSLHVEWIIALLLLFTICKLAVAYYFLDVVILETTRIVPQETTGNQYIFGALQIFIGLYTSFVCFMICWKHLRVNKIWLCLSCFSVLFAIGCVIYTIIDGCTMGPKIQQMMFKIEERQKTISAMIQPQNVAMMQKKNVALKDVKVQKSSKKKSKSKLIAKQLEIQYYQNHHHSVFILNMIITLLINIIVNVTIVSNPILKITSVVIIIHAIVLFIPFLSEAIKEIMYPTWRTSFDELPISLKKASDQIINPVYKH